MSSVVMTTTTNQLMIYVCVCVCVQISEWEGHGHYDTNLKDVYANRMQAKYSTCGR